MMTMEWGATIRCWWCSHHGHRAFVMWERTPWITCRRCGGAWWIADEATPVSGLDRVSHAVRKAREAWSGNAEPPNQPRTYA